MPLVRGNITVLHSATVLATGVGDASNPTSVDVYNKGVAAIYYGAPGVTGSTDGIPIAIGATKTFNLAVGDVVYGAVDTATQTVTVMYYRS